MAEIGLAEQDSSESAVRNRLDNLSFSIWPPSQATRDAVRKRIIQTLSSDNILSKRYGVIVGDEASDAARRFEEEAYVIAGAATSVNGDGTENLQTYATEISLRVIDFAKSRSSSDEAVETSGEDAETSEDEDSSFF